jgi:hypothetical protein
LKGQRFAKSSPLDLFEVRRKKKNNFCSLFSSHLGFSGGGGGAAGGGPRTPVLPLPPLPAASAVALTFTDGVSPTGVLLGVCAGSAFVPAPDGGPGRAIGVPDGCVGVVAAVPVGRRFSVVAVRRSWRGKEERREGVSQSVTEIDTAVFDVNCLGATTYHARERGACGKTAGALCEWRKRHDGAGMKLGGG